MTSVWQSFTRAWSQHFVMQLATLTVLTASFTVVNFFLTLSLNFRSVLADWGHEVQVTAYLKDDLTDSDLSVIRDRIKALGQVDRVEFTSQKDAVDKFSKQLSTYAPDLLNDGGFETNFPASFQVHFSSALSGQVDKLIALAEKMGRIAGIDDVSYGQGWVENYSHFMASLGSLGWTVTSILLLGALFVVGNSIRTSISQRRDEIEILELIGATAAMIRKPYLFEGAMMGALAMGLSLFFNYAFYLAQIRFLETSWNFMGVASKLSFLGFFHCIGLIVTGAVIGVIGAFLTVRRINDGWSASQKVRAW